MSFSREQNEVRFYLESTNTTLRFCTDNFDTRNMTSTYVGNMLSIADGDMSELFNTSAPRSTVQANPLADGGYILSPHIRPPKPITYSVLLRASEDTDAVGRSVKAKVQDLTQALACGVAKAQHGVWGGIIFDGYLADAPQVKYNKRSTEAIVTFTLVYSMPYVTHGWLWNGKAYDGADDVDFATVGTYNGGDIVIVDPSSGDTSIDVVTNASGDFGFTHFGFAVKTTTSDVASIRDIKLYADNRIVGYAKYNSGMSISLSNKYLTLLCTPQRISTGAYTTISIWQTASLETPISSSGTFLLPPARNYRIETHHAGVSYPYNKLTGVFLKAQV